MSIAVVGTTSTDAFQKSLIQALQVTGFSDIVKDRVVVGFRVPTEACVLAVIGPKDLDIAVQRMFSEIVAVPVVHYRNVIPIYTEPELEGFVGLVLRVITGITISEEELVAGNTQFDRLVLSIRSIQRAMRH